jgi:hypothetical protein
MKNRKALNETALNKTKKAKKNKKKFLQLDPGSVFT